MANLFIGVFICSFIMAITHGKEKDSRNIMRSISLGITSLIMMFIIIMLGGK